MTRVRGLIVSLLLLTLRAAWAAPGDPTDPAAAVAQRHWTAGMAHFQLEEWDAAIKEWEDGFRSKPAPQFLYNIAQAYRQSKRYDKALSFYRKYLRMQPTAPNRGEVEGHIATLERLVAEQQKASNSPPVQPLADGVSEELTNRPRGAVATTPAVAPAVQLTTPAPRKESVARKAWFWGVMGGAVAVVAAAVVVGVVVGSAPAAKVLPVVHF